MNKRGIACFVAGALIFGAAGVFAGQYAATENVFPVQLNGENIQIEGYNIEGSTYFKLRDIADIIGGFNVDFNNGTIQLSKDGYVYDNSAVSKREGFVDKYLISELEDGNFAEYDLDCDGKKDTLSVHLHSAYEATGDETLRGFARYDFIINGEVYHIGDMRHGHYGEFFITDIDTSDGYLDIIAIHDYKGISGAIYRFNGHEILQVLTPGIYEDLNSFTAWSNESYHAGDGTTPDDIALTLNSSGEPGFTFYCGNETHTFVKVNDFLYKEE